MLLKRFLVGLLRGYQTRISPLFPPRCRYFPSCSGYAVEAVETHGAAKGMLLAIWRLLRCNPFSKGGVDHVPPKGKWPYNFDTSTPRYYSEE